MSQFQTFSHYALLSLNMLEERMWFFTLPEFNCTPTRFTEWNVLNHTLSRLGFFLFRTGCRITVIVGRSARRLRYFASGL